MFYLSNNPEPNFDRKSIEYLVLDNDANLALAKLWQKTDFKIDALYWALNTTFKAKNQHYAPIEGREYIHNPSHQLSTNQLVGLHKCLAQHLVFNHTPIYLHEHPNQNTKKD